ncbi:uncharacterized protein BDW70DRAFT_35748 [Aspergillus foveolatus]|uniref:uncharacterized protein n=1 Tax=Aspergillus foveolatus TaxID=210207 RepID=UPI003CCE0BE6
MYTESRTGALRTIVRLPIRYYGIEEMHQSVPAYSLDICKLMRLVKKQYNRNHTRSHTITLYTLPNSSSVRFLARMVNTLLLLNPIKLIIGKFPTSAFHREPASLGEKSVTRSGSGSPCKRRTWGMEYRTAMLCETFCCSGWEGSWIFPSGVAVRISLICSKKAGIFGANDVHVPLDGDITFILAV